VAPGAKMPTNVTGGNLSQPQYPPKGLGKIEHIVSAIDDNAAKTHLVNSFHSLY